MKIKVKASEVIHYEKVLELTKDELHVLKLNLKRGIDRYDTVSPDELFLDPIRDISHGDGIEEDDIEIFNIDENKYVDWGNCERD